MRRWTNPLADDSVVLFGANSTLGWRVSRRLSKAEGRRGFEEGRFREVFSEVNGAFLGYQIVAQSELNGDRDLPSLASSAAISVREMHLAVAGAMGESRTAGLPEAKRLERAARRRVTEHGLGERLAPEDAIERAHMKVRVFRTIGAAKGDILRAWPRTEPQPL